MVVVDIPRCLLFHATKTTGGYPSAIAGYSAHYLCSYSDDLSKSTCTVSTLSCTGRTKGEGKTVNCIDVDGVWKRQKVVRFSIHV